MDGIRSLRTPLITDHRRRRIIVSLRRQDTCTFALYPCVGSFESLPRIPSSMHTLSATPRARAKLTQFDALDIYHCKGSVSSATAVSKLYGVCEKAVRDIWTGRTWSKETWHLDEARPLPIRKMGRPLGRKDAQPRKPRGLRPITKSVSWSDQISPESKSGDIWSDQEAWSRQSPI